MKKNLILFTILVLGFGAIFVLSKNVENNKPKLNESIADEDLYFSGKQLNAFGHDFRGLIADWYWINSLQYMGKKIIGSQEQVDINNLSGLNPRLLYPMLDTATTLDPQFTVVYSYGAAVLPAIDNNQAIKLLQKGIAANPDNWRLYHNLGFIYWKMNDFQNASEMYEAGSKKENAPVWMKQMGANMKAEGGSRDFAKQVYQQMFETAEDEQTKTFAELRFYRMESLDDLEAIRPILQSFQKQKGHCINSWRDISTELRIIRLKNNKPLVFDNNNSPVDPTNIPYSIINIGNRCDVNINPESSKIPQS